MLDKANKKEKEKEKEKEEFNKIINSINKIEED